MLFSFLCRLNLRVIFNPPGQPFDEYTVQLADDIDSWNLGDKIVIASTDYNMKQAEEVEVISLEGNLLTFKGMYFSFLYLPFKKMLKIHWLEIIQTNRRAPFVR